ncbi:MAG: alpha/beta fold hydrolase [Trueperaceae bacterium]|nr:alpha/beta fold hydrolase [Trueperaceae bacterium]
MSLDRQFRNIRVRHVYPYRYAESGHGTPVVFVHGNFASRRWWYETLAQPFPGYRYIALDLPGFAGSEVLEPFLPSIGRYAFNLSLFVRRLGLARFVLVGHSLGGAVATEFVTQQPYRVAGLLLLASAPPSGYKTPEQSYPELARLRGNRPGVAQALRAIMASRPPDYLGDLVDDALAMHPSGFVGNARALELWRALGRTSVYRNPVRVVAGQNDPIIPPPLVAATSLAFSGADERLLGGIGHSPQIEAPELFRELLEDFLVDRVSAAPRYRRLWPGYSWGRSALG